MFTPTSPSRCNQIQQGPSGRIHAGVTSGGLIAAEFALVPAVATAIQVFAWPDAVRRRTSLRPPARSVHGIIDQIAHRSTGIDRCVAMIGGVIHPFGES